MPKRSGTAAASRDETGRLQNRRSQGGMPKTPQREAGTGWDATTPQWEWLPRAEKQPRRSGSGKTLRPPQCEIPKDSGAPAEPLESCRSAGDDTARGDVKWRRA